MAIKFMGANRDEIIFNVFGVSRGVVGILVKGLGVDGSLNVCLDSTMKR